MKASCGSGGQRHPLPNWRRSSAETRCQPRRKVGEKRRRVFVLYAPRLTPPERRFLPARRFSGSPLSLVQAPPAMPVTLCSEFTQRPLELYCIYDNPGALTCSGSV